MSDINLQQIIEDYEKTLVFPENKPKTLFFLCPVGLAGAGKTTVMKKLCERLSLLRISNDEIREIIKDPEHFDVATQVTGELGRKYAKLGYSIGVDSNVSSLWNNVPFIKLVESLGAKVIWIHINPPESFIVNKFKNLVYKDTGIYKDPEHALKELERSKQNVKTEGIPFTCVFDTSSDDLDKQIENSVAVIQEELNK